MKTGSKKFKSDILLILAILFLIVGVILLLVDPVKNYLRDKKTAEAVEIIQSQIMLEDTQITFVVDANAYEINGEEYDYLGDEEGYDDWVQEMEEAEALVPDYITLTCVGLLDIDSVNIHIPVWDKSDRITLRYGGGHYEDSVLPGEVGNCTILAHYMRHAETNFHNLNQVQLGDTVKITVPGGHEYYYNVDEILLVTAAELPDYIVGDITNSKQLTLVTCAYTDEGKRRLLVIGHIIED